MKTSNIYNHYTGYKAEIGHTKLKVTIKKVTIILNFFKIVYIKKVLSNEVVIITRRETKSDKESWHKTILIVLLLLVSRAQEKYYSKLDTHVLIPLGWTAGAYARPNLVPNWFGGFSQNYFPAVLTCAKTNKREYSDHIKANCALRHWGNKYAPKRSTYVDKWEVFSTI